MSAAQSCAALTPNGVNLVDKDDARSRLFGLLKEVSHTGCTDADEHLDEVGAADREELNARLAGDRLREKRLARARRAEEQYALGDACAELIELVGGLEELDDFLELLFCFVRPCHIGKGHLFLITHHEAHARLAEVHHTPAAHLGLLHDEEPEADQKCNRDQRGEERLPPRRLGRVFRRDRHALFREARIEVAIVARGIRRNRRELRPILQRTADVVLDNDDLVHVSSRYFFGKITVSQRRCLRRLMAARHVVGNRPDDEEHERIEREISQN